VSTARFRDTLTAATLFIATVAFTLWQNTRVAVLWDISFLLDTAWRFSAGQLPYKTLPFPQAPLTFLLHAAILRVFGRVYFPHILCAALEGGAATLLAWRMLLKALTPLGDQAWRVALLLAAPLMVVGIYGIYPHPIYDGDTILAVLLALYLMQWAGDGAVRNFVAGAACVLPMFFKQNIGMPFLLVVVAAMAVVAVSRLRRRESIAPQMWMLAGAAAALGGALLAIHAIVGLHNYFYWTVTFARQRRLPGLAVMLSTYNQTPLLWTIPAAIAALVLLRREERWARPVAVLLLAAPFLWTIVSLALADDADDRADQLLSLWPHLLILGAALALWNLRPASLRAGLTFDALSPVVLLVTIHGTFLSQQLWGSTYALWPLLMLLIAVLLVQVRTIAQPLAVVIGATLLICGGLYAVSHERLSYIHLDGPIAQATLPELRGLATPGPWIPAFEELVQVTNAEITANDDVLLVPNEYPFYFATGRVTRFPVLLFDPSIDPYTAQETRDMARALNIRWLIVDTNLQLMAPPDPELPEIEAALLPDFVVYRSLTNYTIYRRKEVAAVH
jgi:hypothetical protein